MRQYKFLVPLTNNAGTPFTASEFAWLQDELVIRFGGWTLDGTVQGAWRGADGTVYGDTSRRYLLVTDQPREQVLGFLAQVRDRFQQEALYVEEPQTEVTFL